ncbi:60S ribosomal protein L9 [Cucumispora dikerogammari]|nr:60S ribosomal protein L9 [Cucumispora dikerogammari]
MAILTQELITVPGNCQVSLTNKTLTTTGPAGTNTYNFDHITMLIDIPTETQIRLRLWNGDRATKAKIITAASQIKNMIKGSMNGYKYKLRAIYKHFPISFNISDDKRTLEVVNYLGEKKKRVFNMRGDSIVEMDLERDTISIIGCNLEDVSQSAGTIQNSFRPRKFDFRVFLDGIYISNKEVIE